MARGAPDRGGHYAGCAADGNRLCRLSNRLLEVWLEQPDDGMSAYRAGDEMR